MIPAEECVSGLEFRGSFATLEAEFAACSGLVLGSSWGIDLGWLSVSRASNRRFAALRLGFTTQSSVPLNATVFQKPSATGTLTIL